MTSAVVKERKHGAQQRDVHGPFELVVRIRRKGEVKFKRLKKGKLWQHLIIKKAKRKKSQGYYSVKTG